MNEFDFNNNYYFIVVVGEVDFSSVHNSLLK